MLEHESLTAEGKGAIIADAVKCVSDGSEEVECRYCHNTFVRPISAHKYEVTKEIAATCTEAAQVVSKCKNCGVEKTEVKIVNRAESQPLGHDLVDRQEIPATCTTDGRIARVCTRCTYTEKKVDPATGHKVKTGTTVKYYAAKYDEDGEIIKLKYDASKEEYVKATSDSDAKVIAYSTGMTSCEYAIAECFECENEGTTVNGATTYKEIKTIVAEKQAHSIDTTKTVTTGIFLCDDKGNITINRDSSGKVVGLNASVDCTHAEAQVFTCKTCQKTQSKIVTPKTEHVKVTGSERRVNPTCTVAGYTLYTCSICKAEVRDTEIAKLGHNFAIEEANCTENAKIYCTRCDEKVVFNGTTTLPSTSLAGIQDYYNSLDTAQKNKLAQTATGGHDFTGITATTVNGQRGMYCNVCNEFVPIDETLPNSQPSYNETLDADNTTDSKEKAVIGRMKNVTIEQSGNEISVVATSVENFGTDDGYNNCFCIVLDLNIDLTKIKVLSGNYRIENSDKNSTQVGRWATNPTSTSFIVWLRYADIKDGRTIVFGTEDGSVDPVSVNFKAVVKPVAE